MIGYIRTELQKGIDVLTTILRDDALLSTVMDASKTAANAIREGGKVMFCGNGGSAADSQHLAAELVGKLVFDRPAMAGIALTVDTSAITALGNDFGYEYIFSRQIEAIGRPGDVLVGISTSGRSTNVLRAMETARRANMTTVAFTGAHRGPMADCADYWIAIPHRETQKIQEGHIAIGHILCALIEAEIHGNCRSTR